MFDKIKARVASVKTLKTLCEGAEKHALLDGQRTPGAEHFVLAALDLPDGTARRALMAVGADPEGFSAAVRAAHDAALASIGLRPQASNNAATPLSPRPGLYDAAASGREIVQALAADRRSRQPLVGAHVLALAADMEHGVAARALKLMGVDRSRLKTTANEAAHLGGAVSL